MKHLFIVTYGRTGSTLLMNIVNQAPNARIYGENHGYLYQQFRLVRTIEAWRGFRPNSEAPTAPWYGTAMIDHDALEREARAQARDYFRRNFPEDAARREIVGFKEIRHLVPDLTEYLEFLGAEFENAHVIFLCRNPDEVVGSGFFKDREPGYYRAAIEKFHHDAEAFAAGHPGAATVLWYADMMTEAERTRGVLEGLGIRISAEAYAAALAVPASYDIQSVVEISPGFSIWRNERSLKASDIFFRLAAKDWGDVRSIKDVVLEGVVVAGSNRRVAGVALLRNGAEVATAPVDVPVPQAAQAFPDHPHSANSGFRLTYGLGAGGTASYALVASVDGVGDVELARLSFIAAQ